MIAKEKDRDDHKAHGRRDSPQRKHTRSNNSRDKRERNHSRDARRDPSHNKSQSKLANLNEKIKDRKRQDTRHN